MRLETRAFYIKDIEVDVDDDTCDSSGSTCTNAHFLTILVTKTTSGRIVPKSWFLVA